MGIEELRSSLDGWAEGKGKNQNITMDRIVQNPKKEAGFFTQ